MDKEFATAARKLPPGTRLFAVAVHPAGSVELSELRGGTPVVLGRCRVTIQETPPAIADPPPLAPNGWRGDVEPIGFPFRLGVPQVLDQEKYAFDYEGDWVLAVSGALGLLHAWKVDGTASEILPRGMVAGRPFTAIDSVLGVAGGFVLTGLIKWSFVAIHYDFAERTCTIHQLAAPRHIAKDPSQLTRSWIYIRRLHSVVVRSPMPSQIFSAVDLGALPTLACYNFGDPSKTASNRAIEAAMEAKTLHFDAMPILTSGWPRPETGGYVQLDPQTGEVAGRIEGRGEFRMTPQTDGQPSLKSGQLIRARRGGDVLALLTQDAKGERKLQFHDARELTAADREFVFSTATHEAAELGALRSYPLHRDEGFFALSEDGRRFARRSGPFKLEVRLVRGGLLPELTTARQPFHDRLEVELGSECLVIRSGKIAHLLGWRPGPLTLGRDSVQTVGSETTVAADRKRGTAETYDPGRFVATCKLGGITVWVDLLGHVALLDAKSRLVAMFYVFRQEIAAWLPDGTMLGPPSLIGGPSSPGAAEKFGRALRDAGGKRP